MQAEEEELEASTASALGRRATYSVPPARRGIAQRLMEQLEQEARAEGRTLLVLDAVTGGDAARLYERIGWTTVGVIPNYALYPDGRLCDTTVFWKALEVQAAQ